MRFPTTVTVLRAPLTTDGKGNQISDWANATSTTTPAWLQPVESDAASFEKILNQDRIVSRWRLFLPATADVLATDRITYGADTMFVDGEVQTWSNSVAAHHQEAYLRKVTGG